MNGEEFVERKTLVAAMHPSLVALHLRSFGFSAPDPVDLST